MICAGCLIAKKKSGEDALYEKSPKLASGNANPLLDFVYVADPTAIVHDGRVYVYGTNDQQEFDAVGLEKENSYDRIHSLVMMSSDDMVNWTYHGVIDVGAASPQKGEPNVSWAPSITSRKEADGKTHFYLYYSHGGAGVGMLISTSPVGPWTDPLGRDIVSQSTPNLKDCPAPFDPGVVIDDNGVGWLSFGGGKTSKSTDYMTGSARVVQLGKDMISIVGDIAEIPAPYFFEASELNYINGTWVYSYSTNWGERKEWPHSNIEKPTICCMGYMTSKTPLDKDNWEYRGNFFENPGDYGMPWGNNHTHFLKFKGDYYLFYHTLSLQNYRGAKAGYRSICVEKMQIDENTSEIRMEGATAKGPSQIKTLDAFGWQQAETTSATLGVKFEPAGTPGNMVAVGSGAGQCIEVRGVEFVQPAKTIVAKVKGQGVIEVRLNNSECTVVSTIKFSTDEWTTVSAKILKEVIGTNDLCFVFTKGNFQFDGWTFTA